ncbi:TetR/AcrR family transcriptional regulator [Luteolibacter pohnpeiensis]|uniref:TetR/AcrR family transcriptional regulator n=1 Tax=Luteolibacter pohnpeiensis TaxID=454153 RepID=A0A934S737_9BACT|nr:TetR/AcrR family transcriptional regulator [Luteolibacter pohnpeiensis]MBK1883427.1 TetR/AcrR family transcriptional regulator [Luteolibacter pohnpeiensis]
MARTGRPREFNREEAVRKSMALFWQFGYETTSLSELRSELGGLSNASFYAAFGSKEQLFSEALALYMESCGNIAKELTRKDIPARAAMYEMLVQTISMQTSTEHPSGCMAVLAGTNLPQENANVATMVKQARASVRTALKDCISRAIASGELRNDTDQTGLIHLFDTFVKGIAIQGRDGISADQLMDSARLLMHVWDGYTNTTS